MVHTIIMDHRLWCWRVIYRMAIETAHTTVATFAISWSSNCHLQGEAQVFGSCFTFCNQWPCHLLHLAQDSLNHTRLVGTQVKYSSGREVVWCTSAIAESSCNHTLKKNRHILKSVISCAQDILGLTDKEISIPFTTYGSSTYFFPLCASKKWTVKIEMWGTWRSKVSWHACPGNYNGKHHDMLLVYNTDIHQFQHNFRVLLKCNCTCSEDPIDNEAPLTSLPFAQYCSLDWDHY